LHYACEVGDTEVISLLIKKKASLNRKDTFGWTALNYAARTGNTKSVRVLTKATADPNILSGAGRSPLHLLAQFSYQPKSKEQVALEDALRVC
jgi:ankyrin repeat protein